MNLLSRIYVLLITLALIINTVSTFHHMTDRLTGGALVLGFVMCLLLAYTRRRYWNRGRGYIGLGAVIALMGIVAMATDEITSGTLMLYAGLYMATYGCGLHFMSTTDMTTARRRPAGQR